MSQPEAQPPSDVPADLTVSVPDSWREAIEQRGGPAVRITVIEDSLRCYTYGWLSCLPLVGVAYLFPAVRRFAHARRCRAEWNPARGYLAAGLALASVGWMAGVLTWLIGFASALETGDSNTGNVRVGDVLVAALLFNGPVVIVGLLVAASTAWKVPMLTMRFSQWMIGLVVVFSFMNLCWMFSRLADHGQEAAEWVPFLHIGAWGFWLMAGFITLALRKSGRWAWLVWIAVLAALTLPFLVQ